MLHSSRDKVSVNSRDKISTTEVTADQESANRRTTSSMTMKNAYGFKASNKEFVKNGPLLKSKITPETQARAKATVKGTAV